MDEAGSEPRTVETERLTLRPIAAEDVDELHQGLFDDPEVMRYLPAAARCPASSWTRPWSAALAHWQRHGYGVWVACDRETELDLVRYGIARDVWVATRFGDGKEE
jgi:RimJ/RimL family protein N-acetyltransferase